MRVLRVFAIALLAYAAVVAAFESLIGVLQPSDPSTLVLTTTDADGNRNDRVVTRLENDGLLYVAANHWPRRWYRQALANPDVEIAPEPVGLYRAVPVSPEEHARLGRAHDTGSLFRILSGFPPRRFLRLEPR